MNPSYNNSFGSFSSGGAVPGGLSNSSAGGDIILAGGENTKKSRKGLFIGLAAVAVLLIIGLFALLTMNGGGGVDVSTSAKESFNAYANYLLYGEESTAKIEDTYSYDEVYALGEFGDANNSAIKAFYVKALELWNGFEAVAGDVSDENLAQIMRRNSENLNFAKEVFSYPDIDEQELLAQISNSDIDMVKTWINTQYASLMNSDDQKIKRYGENASNYYNLYAEYLDKLKSAGCLASDAETETCESTVLGDDEDVITRINTAYSAMIELRESVRNELTDDCWNMASLLETGETLDFEAIREAENAADTTDEEENIDLDEGEEDVEEENLE